MLTKLNLLVLTVFMTALYSFSQSGQGTVRGEVKDEKSKEPIYGCKILLMQGGNIKNGASTDFDGKFQFNSVSPGTYDVEVRNEGENYQPTAITGVVISADKITFLNDITMKKATLQNITEVVVVAYKVPLIDRDGGASGATITREDISRLPVRSAAGVAGTVGGVNAQEGGGISVRGSRSDGTYFYIDGIKVRGSSNLPKSAIEEVSVITGGLPANYGDATGGIISVTTRGPSSKFFGSAELVSSGVYFKGKDENGYDGKVIGLDKYGYNLFEGMISGPLWMQKDSTGKKIKPRLGFLLSGNITDELDGRPLAGGSYRIKKDVLNELLENPLRPTGTGFGTFYNSNFLRADDFETVKWRMNSRTTTVSASGKIDVNTGPSVNLTFGGSLNYNSGTAYDRNSSLMNFFNYGYSTSLDYRVYGRFTQRFTNNQEGSSSKIKSAYYNIMVDYSKSFNQTYDKKHGFDIFNYGHVGTFKTTKERTYSAQDENGDGENDYFVQNAKPKDVYVDFTPSEANSALAAVTSQYYNIYAGDAFGHYENLFQIQQGNALRNGDIPQSIYGIWSNVGTPYNGAGKSEAEQFRVTGSGSVNIGDHALSLGFEFEKRNDRSWNVNSPIGIWTIARQLANFHIQELDSSRATVYQRGTYKYVDYEQLNSGYAYTSGTGEYGGQGAIFDQYNNPIIDNQTFFDYNLRKKLGYNADGETFLDIDAYDPNLMQINMFSPDELLNSGNSYISYFGYDHAGNKVKGKTDIDNYFNEFDENRNYKRVVGSFQPIYVSGYIMDKFAFNDIVFNVGLRLDVFSANQPVLKDKYLLFNALTAAEVSKLKADQPGTYNWVSIPDVIADDYVVYVNDVNNPSAINGFRSGDKWYNANGIEVEDARVLAGANGIAPWLVKPSQTTVSSDAFTDYKPQYNLMPRVAFSFPISDEASFFAHYDILTKRPTSGFRFDPTDYQFISQRGGSAILNNPDLKPETTIDYELGFQQVLSKTSSLKISAFYREQRNNVQLINVFEAYPNTYKTYGNRDFGTVKGMTVSYDLRRTGNYRMTAAYTLQFADGTGSDAASAANLINANQPNLRTIFPYDYDQRHAFAITADYRYGEGEDYNGPMIGKVAVFENMGLNIVSNIYSGSPYSRQNNITNEAAGVGGAGLTGTTNGSRLPWQYRLDLQLDKTFNLEFGKDDNKKKAAFLNVYLRVTNLLNQFNVLGVYRATGNWNDDGYLAAAQFQASIQNQLDEQAFRDFYTMKIENAFNISVPRTIRLGVKFDF